MLTIYINYPNPHFTVHNKIDCVFLNRPRKVSYRLIKINEGNIEDVLGEFALNMHKFSATKESNDMWIQIDLNSPEQEIGLINTIRILLGQHYKRLLEAPIKKHC